MYDEHYLRGAILGWRSEHKERGDPTSGLDDLMGMVKEVYERDIAEIQNIEFLQHFRKYTETRNEDKFKKVGEAASEDLSSRFHEQIDEIAMKQQLMANKKITLDQVDVLLHALGHPKYYRNYFAADHGSHDWEDIQTLVLCGMMERYNAADKDSGLEYYRVTEHGKKCLEEVGFKPTSSTPSMGCVVSPTKCGVCSGEEKEPLMVMVPLPPPGVPNKNGDVFPEGIGSKISIGTQVRHENKVVGEISRVSDRKVVAHITRELERKLGSPPASEEIEVQTQIVERAPAGGVPGLVSIEINTSGRPAHFVRMTDHGDHLRVLHTALKLLEVIDIPR